MRFQKKKKKKKKKKIKPKCVSGDSEQMIIFVPFFFQKNFKPKSVSGDSEQMTFLSKFFLFAKTEQIFRLKIRLISVIF